MKREPIHNHITRDIKSPGKCPGCDQYWERHGKSSPTFTPPRECFPTVRRHSGGRLELLNDDGDWCKVAIPVLRELIDEHNRRIVPDELDGHPMFDPQSPELTQEDAELIARLLKLAHGTAKDGE